MYAGMVNSTHSVESTDVREEAQMEKRTLELEGKEINNVRTKAKFLILSTPSCYHVSALLHMQIHLFSNYRTCTSLIISVG